MKKPYLIMILFLSSLPAFSATVNVTGGITNLRSASSYHGSAISGVAPESVFKINTGLHSNCEWLGISADDKNFMSFLLSAQAQGKNVRVWYLNDEYTPTWGSGVCKAITIEMQ